MAKAPNDPIDLARFKKAREAQLRQDSAKPRGPGVLGPNPRAAVILAIVVAVGAALWLWPMLQRLI